LTVRVSRFQLGGTAHKRQEKEQALARIALACTYTYIYVYLRYGERWRELRAGARDKGCTSESRPSRAAPAYI
jgi:hypothetical protein